MKVKCEINKLLEAVNIVDHVVPGRSTIPALTNIKLTAHKKDRTLELAGTDLEHHVIYKITPTEFLEDGILIIPSAKLRGILRETSADEKEISIESENEHGIIKTESSSFKLVGLPPDDFPKIQEFRVKMDVELDTLALEQMINKTLFAVSPETTRTAISGELIEILPDQIRFVATDAKRLAFVKSERKIPTLKSPMKIIVSSKTLDIVSKVLSGEVKTITLGATETQIKIKTENVIIISQLLEGTFPDYEAIIPKEDGIRCEVEKSRFISALRRIMLVATEKSRAVKLSFSKGRLSLIAKNPDVGEAHVQIPSNYEQEPFEIVFNPDYLLDYLKSITEGRLTMYFSDKMAPALFKSSHDHLYVVMPMAVEI